MRHMGPSVRSRSNGLVRAIPLVVWSSYLEGLTSKVWSNLIVIKPYCNEIGHELCAPAHTTRTIWKKTTCLKAVVRIAYSMYGCITYLELILISGMDEDEKKTPQFTTWGTINSTSQEPPSWPIYHHSLTNNGRHPSIALTPSLSHW